MKPRDHHDYGACLEILVAAIYHRIVQAGDTVIDGGANGGLHTAPLGELARPGGHVYAYEPLEEAAGPLQRWIDWAGLGDICHLRGVALGAASGTATFYRHTSSNALSSARRGDGDVGNWEEIRVPFVRLDDEGIVGRCSFIKLDLEGGERDALLGATQLVARDRPVIAFENSMATTARTFGYDVLDFLGWFAELGYEVYDCAGTRATPANVIGNDLVWEFVAVHAADVRRPLILDLMAEFEANYFAVAPAADWNEVMARVHRPFATGFWSVAPAR